MLERDALVAEVATDLVDAVDTADDAALQVQLERHPQVQARVHGVRLGGKRPGRATARDRLQNRRLHFDKPTRVQIATNGGDHAAARQKHLARVDVGHQVEVALPIARFHIDQAVPLLGRVPEALAQQR